MMDDMEATMTLANKKKFENLSYQLNKLWRKWHEINKSISTAHFHDIHDSIYDVTDSVMQAMLMIDRKIHEAEEAANGVQQ